MFFKNMLSSEPCQKCDILSAEIQPCIIASLNEELSREFHEDEVVEALRDMRPLKTSKVDGFLCFFCQKISHIIG